MDFKELGANLGLEEEEYRELIDLFVEAGGLDFKNLQDALEAGDADQVMRSAHTLKGASGNLGLIIVSDAAKHIEEYAMQNRLSGLEQAVRTLQEQFEAIRALVQ